MAKQTMTSVPVCWIAPDMDGNQLLHIRVCYDESATLVGAEVMLRNGDWVQIAAGPDDGYTGLYNRVWNHTRRRLSDFRTYLDE